MKRTEKHNTRKMIKEENTLYENLKTSRMTFIEVAVTQKKIVVIPRGLVNFQSFNGTEINRNNKVNKRVAPEMMRV